MKEPFCIAILASTRGTNLQAIIDEMKAGKMPGVTIACVVSDKKDCYALTRAREQGLETYFIDPFHADGTPKNREAFDQEMAKILEAKNVNLIALTGFMRILTPSFVRKFKGKLINVHPALLPKFGGKNFFGQKVHEAVMEAGEKETGMTIHFVDEGVDTGKIILQKKIPIEPADTMETIKDKAQALEKKWYPEVIRLFASGKLP